MNANTATFADAAPATTAPQTAALASVTLPILRVRLPLSIGLWRYLRPTERRYPLVLLA